MQQSKIFTNDNCVGCNLCISNCPCDEANVAVIQDGKGKILIDPDKCIVCGECIRKCTHNARDFTDDTERFFHDLRAGKQISLIAAPAIRTNFPDYERLLGFLRKAGVKLLYDTSFGADICTWAYLRYMTKNNASGLISQPCPAIVNYIERYQTQLLPKLAPIHSPAMCTAVYMKNYKNISGSYAFLSPCIAKRDEFNDENCGHLVEYNVTYQKLMEFFARNKINYLAAPKDQFDNEQHGLGALYPMPGGLKVNVEQYVNDVWIHQVEGQPHACHFLEHYAKTGAHEAPFLVDILNCQHGCNVGTGALRGEGESLAVGQALHDATLQAKRAKGGYGRIPGPDFTRFDRELELADFQRGYRARAVKPIPVTPMDLKRAYEDLHKMTEADRTVDCRSCGYASCKQMAEAVAKGINHKENCVEYFKSVLEEQRGQMEDIARQREQQAQTLRESVESILASILESGRQADMTKEEVESINSQIELMNDVSVQLGERVMQLQAEINKYTEMSSEIVNISRETNILALNASVEAARAGQFGKGFSVVAEQMKRLSDQSQHSAKSALENNEVIEPLLKRLGDVSKEVRSESQIISSNASNILSTVNELLRIQESIASEANQITQAQETVMV